MKRILFSILVFVPGMAGADKVFNAGRGTTWDCKKDPVITINHGGGTYKVKGTCKTINVNGGGGKLTIDKVDELNLAGARITVTVTTVAAINVMGNENKVTWKTAKTGDAPAINNTGMDNVIAQAGGAKPAAPAAPPAAPAGAPKPAPPAAAGTVIDCAKQATLSYAENGATFTMTGKCDKVLLSGNNNKVKVDSINTVMLSGNENTVEATSAGVIATSGNDNKVTYKTGATATTKPKVSNTGNGNKISAVK